MTAIGVLLIGLGIYSWLATDGSYLPWIGLALIPGILIQPSLVPGILVVMGPLVWLFKRHARQSTSGVRRRRESMVSFWRAVAVYLSAGLTFWQAIESAWQQVPEVAPDVSQMAMSLAYAGNDQQVADHFIHQYPGPEAEIVAGMMIHGYRHGLDPSRVTAQVEQMEERLAFETELKKRGDPIWMTILPGILLLNVVMILFVPMLALMIRHWQGI
jgi:hypothetical protein